MLNVCSAWEINNWSMTGLLCSRWVWGLDLGKDCKTGSDCIISHWGWPEVRGWQYNKQQLYFTLLYWMMKPRGVMTNDSIASMCSIEARIYNRTDTTEHFASLWSANNPVSQTGHSITVAICSSIWSPLNLVSGTNDISWQIIKYWQNLQLNLFWL